MLRISIFFCLLIAVMSVTADLDYIVAFKPPVTDETFEQAKLDVEAAGGKVTYEFRAAMKAILVSLPSEQYTTFNTKPYVDFMEEDKTVHIA